MVNSTRKENISKIKNISGGLSKATKLLKILMIVISIIMLILSVTFAIIALSNLATKIYESNTDLFGNLNIKNDTKTLIFISERNVKLSVIYANGSLNNLVYGYALNFLIISVELVIYAIILHFLTKLFNLINENETPFNVNLLKPFRICFIILTLVLVLRYSVVCGILVGGILACLYFIYAYGCNMQEDEDMML